MIGENCLQNAHLYKQKGPCFTRHLTVRQLEKAVGGSGNFWNFSGVPEQTSRKVPGKLLEKFPRIANFYKFQGFGHRERQTCREPWVDTALDLVPHSVWGVFRNRQLQPSRIFLTLNRVRLSTPDCLFQQAPSLPCSAQICQIKFLGVQT